MKFNVRFDAAAPIIIFDNRFDPAAINSRVDPATAKSLFDAAAGAANSRFNPCCC